MAEISDCKDEGCEECDVCRYLNFLEWAGNTAPRDIPSSIQRDANIEAYLNQHYPHWNARQPSPV